MTAFIQIFRISLCNFTHYTQDSFMILMYIIVLYSKLTKYCVTVYISFCYNMFD